MHEMMEYEDLLINEKVNVILDLLISECAHHRVSMLSLKKALQQILYNYSEQNYEIHEGENEMGED